MSLLTGILLFSLGIQRACVYISAIPALFALSSINCIHKGIRLGEKLVWIPLLGIVIVTLVGESLYGNKIFMVALIPVYLAGVRLKWQAFKLMNLLVIIAVISVIVTFALSHGKTTGGIFSETNYNIAIGMIALGLVVSRTLWLYPIGILGLLLTGGAEALLAICGLITVLIANRKWSLVMCCLAIGGTVMIITLPLGLWDRAESLIGDWSFGNRMDEYREVLSNISWLGHGYQSFELDGNTVHNGFLIALHQVGIAGALCWLWILLWGLFKSSSKRVWVIIGVLSIFDNFMWAQLGAWYWYLAGATQREERDICQECAN